MLATNRNPVGPDILALVRRGGARFFNESQEQMPNRKNGLWAGAKSRLYGEFARFYTSERCQWAPTNPERVFNVAFGKTFREYRGNLSDEQVLAALYAALGYRGAGRPGLFQTFDPTKYAGTRPLDAHFVSLFARKLRGKLDLLQRRTTDCGRVADPTRFRSNPALGLVSENEMTSPEPGPADDLPAVLGCLDARERGVIHLMYWSNLSARKVGTLLGLDHKTVTKVHDTAVRKLRRVYGVGENHAA